jgi:hypothetical protein
MADFLNAYSIQHWLESCPQGYLEGTQYGSGPSESEPELILDDPLMREQAISLTVQLVAGVVGQNIVLEGMAFSVFEMLHAGLAGLNPKFAHTLSGTIADERRHVGFSKNRIGSLIQDHPERKPEIHGLSEAAVSARSVRSRANHDLLHH